MARLKANLDSLVNELQNFSPSDLDQMGMPTPMGGDMGMNDMSGMGMNDMGNEMPQMPVPGAKAVPAEPMPPEAAIPPERARKKS
jgi:hypothetical protein